MWIMIDGDYYNLDQAAEVVVEAGECRLWMAAAAIPVVLQGAARDALLSWLDTNKVLTLRNPGIVQEENRGHQVS